MVRPSEGDRATIANCFIEKDWGCRRIIREFPNKRWADEQELNDAIVQSWERITLEQIRSCLSSWKKRLRLVCQADGGHIEHLL